ncbi:MAG: SDR family oxidoreductase [Angelakisella sp.]|nr:SDR family oxidoreductase [Angelakisella sp.]
MMERQVVIITGASVGIGRAAAIAFGGQGAKVVVNYVSSEESAKETARAVIEAGGEAALCQADVSNPKDARRLVEFCVETFGRLDVLVNNAGITAFIPFGDLDSVTPEVWEKLYRTNVEGTFFCSREAARVMKPQGKGSIINLSSRAGMRPVGSSIPYGVSKAAILHLTECLAVTLAPQIRVNCVSPGTIGNTRWNQGRPNFDEETYRKNAENYTPMRRLGHPDDIVPAILYLASDASGFCTGINIPVDGGASL